MKPKNLKTLFPSKTEVFFPPFCSCGTTLSRRKTGSLNKGNRTYTRATKYVVCLRVKSILVLLTLSVTERKLRENVTIHLHVHYCHGLIGFKAVAR